MLPAPNGPFEPPKGPAHARITTCTTHRTHNNYANYVSLRPNYDTSAYTARLTGDRANVRRYMPRRRVGKGTFERNVRRPSFGARYELALNFRFALVLRLRFRSRFSSATTPEGLIHTHRCEARSGTAERIVGARRRTRAHVTVPTSSRSFATHRPVTPILTLVFSSRCVRNVRAAFLGPLRYR